MTFKAFVDWCGGPIVVGSAIASLFGTIYQEWRHVKENGTSKPKKKKREPTESVVG